MTGCRIFHIFGILSSYAEDPTLLTTGKGPALKNDSFLVGLSVLMFAPSAHTRSPSPYLTASPRFLSALLFITLFVLLSASSTSFLAFCIPG